MSAKGKPTPTERLEALVEAALTKAKAGAAEGEPPAPVALGTLARLVERLEQKRELEQLRELAAD